ncbi:hypothetical protein [Mycolicibacterium lutetiense]
MPPAWHASLTHGWTSGALRAMNLSRPVAGLFTGSVRDDLELPDYRIG